MANKKKRIDKVFNYTICLRGDQVDWINSHSDLKVHKFVRDQLDKYIKLKNEVNQLATTG